MSTAATILNPPADASTPPEPSGNSGPAQKADIASPGWWDNFKDNDVKAWAANKKYESPELLATSARSLEQLYGADKAGRTVILPKDEKDVEGLKAFHAKLGVPDTPDGYKLPLPEGDDGKFSKIASTWFHQNGVPAKAAEGISKAWNDYIGNELKASAEAEKAKSEQELTQLKGEWGADFDKNGEISRRGLREISKAAKLEDADLQKLESALGTSKMLRLFHNIGLSVGESSFAGGGANGSFNLSPSGAQAKLAELQQQRAEGKISNKTWDEKSAELIAAITGYKAA